VIPAPLVLVGGPLVIASVVYLVRRLSAIAALLSASTALAVAWLAGSVPTSAGASTLSGWVAGGPWVVLGRTLEVTSGVQAPLIAISLVTAVLLLLAVRLQPGGIFFPGLLAWLGVAAAVLVTQTFTFRVLLVEVAVGLTTMLLQGTRFGSTRGAWRFFLFSTMAMPLLLVASWQIDFQTANPAQVELLDPAVLLLTLGFTIYLSAAPFHLWMAPAATEAETVSQVVALSLFPMLTLSVIVQAFERYPWFASSTTPYQWFTFVGILTAALGTVLAFHARNFGRISSYSLMVDTGAVLLLLGTATQLGLICAWALLLSRAVSLVVWAAGLCVIRRRTQSDQVDTATSVGWDLRLATAVLVLGGLSLAGFPLTPGFAARWMALGLLARAQPSTALLLLLGTASSAAGVLYAARVLLALGPHSAEPAPAERWQWVNTVALLLVIAGAVLLSLYPNPLLSAAAGTSGTATYFP